MNSREEYRQLKLLLKKLSRDPEKNALAINSVDMEITLLEDELFMPAQQAPEGWSTK